MKQRWLSLLFALGALLLFYVLFIGSPTGLNDQVARPTASSTDANGYAGARAWLVQQGVAVRSLRERYTALGSQNLAPAGNLLLVTLPGVERFQSEEFASLDIMELNPALDVRNQTALLAVDLVESLFGKSTLMRD